MMSMKEEQTSWDRAAISAKAQTMVIIVDDGLALIKEIVALLPHLDEKRDLYTELARKVNDLRKAIVGQFSGEEEPLWKIFVEQIPPSSSWLISEFSRIIEESSNPRDRAPLQCIRMRLFFEAHREGAERLL